MLQGNLAEELLGEGGPLLERGQEGVMGRDGSLQEASGGD